ncbi:CIS tube protein [Chryseobacterium indoltheticum]|uniref:LysM peptidoglycan-binding domain-containing protein n=1 Tax=Chryseobacterium indoltheticum TaxID=254 RepID=A0A3G6N4R6_9FLAO|nr:LysM peptidoglycan-binding domain-containing protein [Chryseobacterium indoltheticum]AZA62981.1 LysM peptidoglycan-binding domain-containing protein [Chryseobacterium indoltheticum]
MRETGKVTIQTYKDNSYGKKESVVFTALINPTGFSLTHKVEYNTERKEGANATNSQFIKKSPQTLQLEFLFDGTGVTKSNPGNKLINKIKEGLGKDPFSKMAVEDQLIEFYAATGDFNGTIHKPYTVIVTWGKFKFEGSLTEFTIDYKLFNKDGSPLRAIGKATFLESISDELAARMANKNSPDLTHKRIVQDGDTLPLMTERIYGDSKYYLEVAKVNGLVNFRQLKPGSEVYFPPLDKIS